MARRSWMTALSLGAVAVACGGSVGLGEIDGAPGDDGGTPSADGAAGDGSPGTGDPCEGVSLPTCPAKCATFPMQGACAEGDACAINDIGDECACASGTWACSVHPPLGPGCNKVCRGGLEERDGGATPPDGGACDPTKADACGPGKRCKSDDCVTGTCVDRVKETSRVRDPVCGCDGYTYWNENVAHARGMSAPTKGACAVGAATPNRCGGPGPERPCAAGFFCHKEMKDSSGCAQQAVPGNCWAAPTDCPILAIDPSTRACGAPMCAGECELLKQNEAFYVDATCPK